MVESRRDPHTWTAAGLMLACAVGAHAGADVDVQTTHRDDAIAISCRAVVAAPAELIWETLTDYDRLAEFIPGMRRSRVIERHGTVSIVEQQGEARFLFLSFPIEVTLSSLERPPHVIEVTLIKGNLKRLQGVYRLEPQGGGRVVVTWNGLVEAEGMPPLLGELVLRGNIEDQFRGMVREIERRVEARKGGAK